jgi:hypothetical protein
MAKAKENGEREHRIPMEIVVDAYGREEQAMNISGLRADICWARWVGVGLFVCHGVRSPVDAL